jgi:hypothetical protein
MVLIILFCLLLAVSVITILRPVLRAPTEPHPSSEESRQQP